MTRLSLRVDLGPAGSVGPGKIRLLELIRETGSISAAGRAMDMSYRRAWLLVDELNRIFREPVVETKLGGRDGGGTGVTPAGERLIATYRMIEAKAAAAAADELAAMQQAAVAPAAVEAVSSSTVPAE